MRNLSFSLCDHDAHSAPVKARQLCSTALAVLPGAGMRDKAGVRVGRASGTWRPYGMLEAVKEFEGDNAIRFGSGGFGTVVDDEAGDAYGLVALGTERMMRNGGVFVQAEGAFGEIEGWGLRIGARSRW